MAAPASRDTAATGSGGAEAARPGRFPVPRPGRLAGQARPAELHLAIGAGCGHDPGPGLHGRDVFAVGQGRGQPVVFSGQGLAAALQAQGPGHGRRSKGRKQVLEDGRGPGIVEAGYVRGSQGVAAVVGRDPKPGKGPDHGGADGGQTRVPGQDGQQVGDGRVGIVAQALGGQGRVHRRAQLGPGGQGGLCEPQMAEAAFAGGQDAASGPGGHGQAPGRREHRGRKALVAQGIAAAGKFEQGRGDAQDLEHGQGFPAVVGQVVGDAAAGKPGVGHGRPQAAPASSRRPAASAASTREWARLRSS